MNRLLAVIAYTIFTVKHIDSNLILKKKELTLLFNDNRSENKFYSGFFRYISDLHLQCKYILIFLGNQFYP